MIRNQGVLELKKRIIILFFYTFTDMKLNSIKRYRINTIKVKTSLSHILSQTRRRTSKVVKFWKHLGQIVRERIPVIAPLQELIS
jgi:hypothetical protein